MMSNPDLERRPPCPRPNQQRAHERYARYFAPINDEHRSLSGVDVPSSPLSALSGAESWSGSSNTQEQLTPPTPDFYSPSVTVSGIATPGAISVSGIEDDKTMINSLPTLHPKETPLANIAHRVDPLAESIPIGELDQHPIAVTCESRLLPYEPPAPALSENTLSQLPPVARRRKVQQVPQKHVSWSSAIVSDSSSIPRDLETRIPPIAPVEHLSKDELKKVQSFLRELQELDKPETRLTSTERSSAPRCDRTQLLSPKKRHDEGSDDFSWEAKHSTGSLADPDELADPTRCSLLIQEVSLMVGMTSDSDRRNLDGGSLLESLPVPNVLGHSERRTTGEILPGIRSPLPLNIVPAESLALRGCENAPPSFSRQIDHQVRPSEIAPLDGDPKKSSVGIHNDYSFLKETSPPVRFRGSAASIPRHKSADAIHPSAQSRRRHGQVFQFDRPTNTNPPGGHAKINGTLAHPRESVDKPLPSLPPSRLSSLNRLEYSLEMLKAHAPAHHHKSQSEGMSPSYLERKPPVLKKQQSNYEISPRKASRPARGRHFSSPMPPVSASPVFGSGPTNSHVPSEDEHEHLSTPGSFMDMDIPTVPKVLQKKRISFRHATNNEKMKTLVQAAKRVSRRVISWGKNLAGPSKPSTDGVKMTPTQRSYI